MSTLCAYTIKGYFTRGRKPYVTAYGHGYPCCDSVIYDRTMNKFLILEYKRKPEGLSLVYNCMYVYYCTGKSLQSFIKVDKKSKKQK